MIDSKPIIRQRGAALLLMMLAVLISMTAILLTRLNAGSAHIRQRAETRSVLAQARDALIDYAALHQDRWPGEPLQFPCPDLDGSGATIEGESHTGSCGASGISMIGRLPWRTLGTKPLRDSSKSCLWYVVSGSVKGAAAAIAALINPDTNGQLRLFSRESGTVIAGAQPEDRPLALVFAPMAPLPGQNRSGGGLPGLQCGTSFQSSAYLDSDSLTSLSNASLSGLADTVDDLVVAAQSNDMVNDQVAIVSRADLQRAVINRPDFLPGIEALGLAVSGCLADYARNNPGGANDRRLPWPAPLGLSDYRPDGAYDDTNSGSLSGRLADTLDDSNAATGNAIAMLLTNCDATTVAGWSPDALLRWRHWKDHFFYAVAESFAPDAVSPSICSNCLSVNGSGQYAAVVLFANQRLAALGQRRNAPPIDTDTRSQPSNYLEGINVANFPYTGGGADFESRAPDDTFNDLLFCIDSSLAVSRC